MTLSSSTENRQNLTFRKRVQTLIPWIGTTALLLWLISSHDMIAVGDALMQANLGGLALLWVLSIGLTFVTDAAGLWLAFSRLNGPLQFLAMLRIKGISYFLNIVNYAAASGGIAWLVSKRASYPLTGTASSILFLNVVDLLVLNVFVSVGLGIEYLGGHSVSLLPSQAQTTLIWVNVIIYGLYFGSMAYWNLGLDFLVLGRLRTWRIFSAFSRATLRTHVVLFAARFVLLSLYIAMQYIVVHMFHIDATIGAVMVINTVVTLVQTVPISVAGFGTVQVAMLELYAPYGTDSAILAYSTASLVVFILLRAAIGYICLMSDSARSKTIV